MDKKTTTLLAVGVLAGVAYLLWKQQAKPKSFASAVGRMSAAPTSFTIVDKCKRMVSDKKVKYAGNSYYNCCGLGILGIEPGPVGCSTSTAAF